MYLYELHPPHELNASINLLFIIKLNEQRCIIIHFNPWKKSV